MALASKDYNVLFIISDQHHAGVSGCYGDSRVQTPNIDRIAAEGALFENAYCQEPICGPSRASIMTGTYPHTCNSFSHQERHVVPEGMPTLGSVFREAGYRTGSIGKVHVAGEDKQHRDLGFDERALRYYTYGLKDYEDLVGVENVDRHASHRKNSSIKNAGMYNPNNEPVTLADELMYDQLVTDRCLDFIERNKDSRFFLWMGLEKPHPQWYAPARFHEMYDPAEMVLPETRELEHRNLPERYMNRVTNGGSAKLIKSYTEEQQRKVKAAYYANVSYIDYQIGRALQTLDRLDLTKKTIVVYTSDHGEHLMEHRLFQKHGMYEASVGVPLTIRCPDVIPAGLRKKSMVELIDLFPSLLEMTGVPRAEGLEGHSFVKLVQGPEEDDRREAFSEYYPGKYGAERMIRSGPWKYAYTHGDLEQLYNLDEDPDEMENLAVKAEYREVCDRLKARVMDGWEIDEFDYLGEGTQAPKPEVK